ncbi:hypothetical protein, partial [Achromobacter marplatensis]|uniref:hypothetical protein n=1 Tax=Achromobacter marplatensis TaxID=470868 RepID=UPI001F17599B
DADGHDALFWAKRLGDVDFFANLGPARWRSGLASVRPHAIYPWSFSGMRALLLAQNSGMRR